MNYIKDNYSKTYQLFSDILSIGTEINQPLHKEWMDSVFMDYFTFLYNMNHLNIDKYNKLYKHQVLCNNIFVMNDNISSKRGKFEDYDVKLLSEIRKEILKRVSEYIEDDLESELYTQDKEYYIQLSRQKFAEPDSKVLHNDKQLSIAQEYLKSKLTDYTNLG